RHGRSQRRRHRGVRDWRAAGPLTPCGHGDARGSEVSPRSLRQDQLVQCQISHRLAKPFVLLLELLQLPALVTAHAAILLAPPVIRQLRNADLANRIRHRHPLAAQNFNLPKLRDNLVGLVSLVCHRGPPSWSKPYFKVDPFNGGGSLFGDTTELARRVESADQVTRYMISCMKGVFGGGVSDTWLPLGKGGSHWFSLIFAWSNPSKSATELASRVS